MSDYAKGRETRTEGVIVDRVFCAGQEAAFVFGKGTQVFPNLPVPIYGCTEARSVDETDALWFEFGFKIDASLSGNAAAGFTDSGNYLRIDIEQSIDLVNWSMGKFVPAPTPVINNGDGTWTYWSRCLTPVWWYNVLVDLSVESSRYGKSITNISIGGVTVSLPGYPYAMPSQAATLQTHLRAAGYTGAVVSSVSSPLVAEAKNHHPSGRTNLPVTMAGSNVTVVKDGSGSTISLPGYPYAMPAQRATLQTHLIAAGFTGAVVMLYADSWSIFLPDRLAAVGLQRQTILTITPDDPYPAWDMFGTYQGFQSAAAVVGTHGNVRPAGGGGTLDESDKQFARLKLTSGTRYQP